MKRQRKIKSILRQKKSDPPGLNKGDPRKQWCYKPIEQVVSSGKVHSFIKIPKRSYEIQLCLDQVDHVMFISSQYKLIDKFEDRDKYKRFNLRFHAILGKHKEEVWSLVKIVKVLNICRESLFEWLLQNFQYYMVRANNVACDFSVADFL